MAKVTVADVPEPKMGRDQRRGAGYDWPSKTKFSDAHWSAAKKAYEAGTSIKECSRILGARQVSSIENAAERYGWVRKAPPEDGQFQTAYRIPRGTPRGDDLANALTAVREGASDKVAAAAGRFRPGELEAILEENEVVRIEFDKARADLAVEMAANIRAKSKQDAKAAQWLLERSPFTKQDYKSAEPAGVGSGNAIQVVMNIERAAPPGSDVASRIVDIPPMQVAGTVSAQVSGSSDV